MKTKLLKLALCAFVAALPIGAWGDDNNVSTITTWTFSSIDNGTTYSTYGDSYNYIAVGNNDLYARVLYSSGNTFTVNELATSQDIEFADGHQETITKVLKQNTRVRNPNYILSTATASQVVSGIYAKKNETTDTEHNYNGTGMLAFNTIVGGTIYVAFKSSGTTDKGFRIYHKDFGTTTTTVVGAGHSSSTVLNSRTFNTNGTLQYVSATTESAGTFFIGDVSISCDIYAIRFVPTTYTLTVNTENGTVSRSPEKSKYDYGDVVTLTATPADGYKFTGWSGDATGTTNPLEISMDADKTITANFAAYAATVNIGSTGYATFANTTGSTLAVPEHLTAYGVSGFSSTGVTFQEYNVIPAGVGVILQAEDGYESKSYGFDDTEEASTYSGSNFLVPVTEAKTVPATEYPTAESISAIQNYIFANKEEGVGFYKSSGSGEISAGKAYLSIPNPAQTTRTWDFITDGWSNTTIDNLETERKMATASTETSAGTAVEGELWIYSAYKGTSGNYNYRYINTSAVSNAELYANNSKISETQGLLFNAGSASRLGIDNRDNKQIYLFNENVTITIPGLIKGSTVAITSRVGDTSQVGSMTCTDATNVTRTGADASTSAIVNSFTINKSALSYTFAPSRVMNVHKIVVTPPAPPVSGTREFLGFDGLESETTAIKQIETKATVNDDAWYTLQGVRIAQPSKGIYIHNGKKVFIK